MIKSKLRRTLKNAAVLGTLSMIFSGSSFAVDYHMCAMQQDVAMPDGALVPMWGFALDDDGDLTNGCPGPIQVPGPALAVDASDPVLNIHLRNDISGHAVSLIIPGQTANLSPVTFTDSNGRERVRSFTTETATGGTTIYTWPNMRPGSFVYQSGTHQAVQIQMGLYGSVVKNAVEATITTNAEAYPGIEYVTEKVVFYSEVDPVLHQQVASGEYGTTGMTSTIHYNPTYFLINGEDALVNTLTGFILNEPNLIRFMNMGLKTHVPVLHNADMQVIAEDGHVYTYPRTQYSVMLAAGQTRDVVVTPEAVGDYPMFDRMLNLTNRWPQTVVALATTSSSEPQGDTRSSPGSLISLLKVGTDQDTDRVVDYMDNCSLVTNPSQVDTDNDGFGNQCDADLDNSGLVNTLDIVALLNAYRTQDVVADFNVDGKVNSLDIIMFIQMFLKAPGPSALNG